jgi:hypothetical protein
MPTSADGSGDVVVIESGVWTSDGFTSRETVELPWLFALSVRVIVKLTVPGEGGVPVSRPAVLSVNQEGCPLAVKV